MEVNILEGVYIRVDGEAGQTNGLAWHIVESMFSHLQSLIESLAKYELETTQSPNLKDFEIEIFDFKPGSAVPAFRVVPKSQIELVPVVNPQKMVVAEKFDQLMSFANKKMYEGYFKKDGLAEVRYEIGEDLFGFIQSADNSPISIVQPTGTKNGKETYREIYKIPKFNKEQSEFLLKPRRRRKTEEEPEQIYGLIQRIGKRRKIISLYDNKDTVLSVSIPQIVSPDRIYELHTPLICTVEPEDGHFVIKNDLLDLYAVGASIDEAEVDFCIEFDASYKHLNDVPDKDLSDRLLRAKKAMKSFIKNINNE